MAKGPVQADHMHDRSRGRSKRLDNRGHCGNAGARALDDHRPSFAGEVILNIDHDERGPIQLGLRVVATRQGLSFRNRPVPTSVGCGTRPQNKDFSDSERTPRDHCSALPAKSSRVRGARASGAALGLAFVLLAVACLDSGAPFSYALRPDALLMAACVERLAHSKCGRRGPYGS